MTKIRTLICLRCKGRKTIPKDWSPSSIMTCPACNGDGVAKYIEINKKLYRIIQAET